MRVLHVVTWLDEVNTFGGPVTVAKNLCEALSMQGDEVQLIGAGPTRSVAAPARVFKGLGLLPRLGFSGRLSPSLLLWVATNASNFDVVHVHISRDLVTLPAAQIAQWRGVPTVLQAHGMVDESSRRLARAIDRVMTRRVFRNSKAILALTPRERSDLRIALGVPESRIDELPNGIALPNAPQGPRAAAAVFISRLHPRKRPLNFVRSATLLLQRRPDSHWQFTLAGPDEGEGNAVRQAVETSGDDRLCYIGSLTPVEVQQQLVTARCLVLPSVDEPFPMIVLEALATATPVIVTESCGLADFVRSHQAGVVVPDDDVEQLAAAMEDLLADESTARACGVNGKGAVADELSISSVATRLREIYDR